MRILVTGLGLIVIGGIWLASMFFNAKFGYTFGQSDLDHKFFAAVSIVIDGLKTLLPFWITGAIIHKKYLQTTSMIIAFTLCIILSLVSAIEYGAKSRSAATNKIVTQYGQVQSWQTSLNRKKAQLSVTPDPITAQEYSIKIQALKNSTNYKRRWKSTKGCTKATTPKSQKLCKDLTNLNLKYLQAKKNEKLEAEIKILNANIVKAGLGNISEKKQAPKMALATITGISSQAITTGLVIILAILLEMASSLGFWWVLDYKPSKQKKPKPRKKQTKKILWLPLKELFNRPQMGCVNAFVQNNTKYSHNNQTGTSSAYSTYKRWCEATGQKPITIKKFKTNFTTIMNDADWQKHGQHNGEIIWLHLDFKKAA